MPTGIGRQFSHFIAKLAGRQQNSNDGDPTLLCSGMPLQFTVDYGQHCSKSSGCWSGWIIRTADSALSLAVEWESVVPGRMSPKTPTVREKILVTVTGQQGLYQFSTLILDVREDENRTAKCHIVVAAPKTVTTLQRRRFSRHHLTIPATLQAAENGTPLPQHATIRDISSGGLRVELGGVWGITEAAHLIETHKIGTLLHIRLPLPLIPSEGILARVCLCERTAQRGGLGVRIACEFLPMPDFDADLLLTQLSLT